MSSLSISLVLFITGMVTCLVFDITMIIPLLLGFFLFSFLAYRQGHSLKDIMVMIRESLNDSFIVIGILLLIGCLTGLWRMSGTIAYFIDLGVSLIPPSIFILAAFLLTAIMSFALGTSFGVTATAGVILMSIARAGGVNTVLAAGAIFSGVYVGDRGSPAASSGNLVAVLTHTDMNDNVKIILKDALIPLIITAAIYGIISIFYPMTSADTTVIRQLNEAFDLNWICLLPAVIMVVLPFAKVSIKRSMVISIIVSIAICIFIQNSSIFECLKTMLMGYTPADPKLNVMLSGGGMSSMVEVAIILFISGTYGSIFKKTGMLDGINSRLGTLSKKLGRFPLVSLMSVAVAGIFCNQTIGIIMIDQLTRGIYDEDEKTTRMIDIEDSIVLISGLVPWCIACSVPLAMLGADASSLPFAFYLYLVPLFHYIRQKTAKN